jgi:hypothetical protein
VVGFSVKRGDGNPEVSGGGKSSGSQWSVAPAAACQRLLVRGARRGDVHGPRRRARYTEAEHVENRRAATARGAARKGTTAAGGRRRVVGLGGDGDRTVGLKAWERPSKMSAQLLCDASSKKMQRCFHSELTENFQKYHHYYFICL